MSVALFPGQGVQSAGMDLGLAETETFAVASAVLDVDLAELCITGSSGRATLSSTRWAQPAVLVCSVASYRELVAAGHDPQVVAGHSVGEYGALVAASALDFEDALRLIARRAAATADVATSTDGAMAALMRLEIDEAVRICADAGVSLAADNAPGQCVVSGEAPRIDAVVVAAGERRAIARRLDVDGAFHSALMEPATEALRDALSTVDIRPPAIAFWSSTTATRLDDPEAIRRSLLAQLTSCVRWRETVASLAASPAELTLLDVGPGRVVGGLARRIVPQAEILYADDLLRPAAVS